LYQGYSHSGLNELHNYCKNFIARGFDKIFSLPQRGKRLVETTTTHGFQSPGGTKDFIQIKNEPAVPSGL
jgi:hypothetical protein